MIYQNKAISLRVIGDLDGALSILDKSIRLREESLRTSSADTNMEGLAIAYYNRGNLLMKIERLTDALEAYDQAVSILELLIFNRGRQDIRHYLAPYMSCLRVKYEKRVTLFYFQR